MTSPNKPKSKSSRVAKISVRPIWRKKLNTCDTSSENNVNSPTPIPKSHSTLYDSSQEINPSTQANHNSIPFSDICVTNDEDTPILPQVVNPPPLTQTNPHVASMIHTQTQGDNQTQLTPTPSPRVESTAKTRRPQPRSDTMNDRVPSASKSSCIKNKEVEVEEHHMNLLLSKNKKHTSCECNNIKLAIRNDKSEVVYAMKSKKASHPPKPVPNSKQRLHLLHMDLCGPMRVECINGKQYILVIVDDYSRYTWVHFLKSKDEAPENNREDIRNLGAKDFEQSSLKPGLQSMTFGQISLGLDLTYALSIIASQKQTERKLDLLFEAMYDDYISGQPSVAPRTTPAAPANQNLQTPNASTTVEESAPTVTNSSLQSPNIPNTSQDVDELPQQQHV
ncbi:retrovirus-related pol polyprotein from transposon TNT 1-94 [Tanacetum coccineum]|uniref:Retrovirus-related pol polyprotein from transposon TNT 1-94 n=1 Tax=Tanacetum coccineum TaxID=301880 RepID=A0ABQ5I638_9ASTR